MSDIGPVLILAGGLSPEREVSLRSGSRLQAVLRNAGVEADIADVDAALIPALEAYPPAVVFPVLHGAGGEDGSVQQILTLFGIPYVGATADACRTRSGSYDYAARYIAGRTEFHTPARLPPAVMTAAAAAALTLHRALGLRDLSRTDLIVSGDQVFFLEANVMPGLTETSTLPMAVASAGLDLGAVFRDLLVQAANRGH